MTAEVPGPEVAPTNQANKEDDVTASVQTDRISQRVENAFQKVPSIGERWTRWYDLPYKLLWFLQTGWRQRIVPRRLRAIFSRYSSDLLQFNEVDRDKICDPTDQLHDYLVPSDEHVHIPGVWVVEFFTPSALPRLEYAIRRNGWDKERRMTGALESNQDLLLKSRARMGWSWWRMAEIQNARDAYASPDHVRAKIPAEFDRITLKAVQIGAGLTALVAHFHVSGPASARLDETWHEPRIPKVVRRNGRLQALNQMWAGYRTTQSERARLHMLARQWMNKNCNGFFSEQRSANTLIDILLLDQFDPSEKWEERDTNLFDTFRALGITETSVYRYQSIEIPKMTLVPTRASMTLDIGTDHTWTIWGQRQAVATSSSHLGIYGDDPHRSIANRYSEAIESLLVTLAVSDFLETVDARYALIRDRARLQHGQFKSRAVSDLRQQFLTLSLDVSTTRRDLESFWITRPGFEHEVEFSIEYNSRILRDSDNECRPTHMNTELRKRQREWFERIVAADHDYRNILATVASLGASVNAAKTGSSQSTV